MPLVIGVELLVGAQGPLRVSSWMRSQMIPNFFGHKPPPSVQVVPVIRWMIHNSCAKVFLREIH